MIREWRPRLRRLLGGAFYCSMCGARLDLGLGVLEIASPSRLHAEHAPVCPMGPLARAFAPLAEFLRVSQDAAGRAFQDGAARALQELARGFRTGMPDDQR